MNTIKKMTGTTFKQRMTVKTFKDSDSMHKFLNSQFDNSWSECKENLKSGVYAFCGGQWHNVKTLDSSVLAHV